MNIDPDAWTQAMRPKGNIFARALDQLDHLRLHARALGQSWVRGLRQAERLFRPAEIMPYVVVIPSCYLSAAVRDYRSSR